MQLLLENCKKRKKYLLENQKDITMSELRNLTKKEQNEGVRAYGNQYKEEHHDKEKAH